MKKKDKSYVLNSTDVIILFLFILAIITIVFVVGVAIGKNMEISKLEKEKKFKNLFHDTSEIPSEKVVTPISVEESDINEEDIKKSGISEEKNSVVKTSPKRKETITTPKKLGKKENTKKQIKPKPKNLVKKITPHKPGNITRTFYIVQVMATKDIKEAEKYKQKLKKMGFEVYIRNPAFKGDYYRVQLGSFRNKNNAFKLLGKLKKLGVNGFVRKEKIY